MLTIQFSNRDFTPCLEPSGGGWQVERLTWKDMGGPAEGLISRPALPESPALPLDWLRRPVMVRDETGMPVWWGYAHAVEAGGLRWSLDELCNWVRASYRVEALEGLNHWNTLYTSAQEDLISQARYGERQRYITAGNATLAQAEILRGCYLSEHGEVRSAGFGRLSQRAPSPEPVEGPLGWCVGERCHPDAPSNPGAVRQHTLHGSGLGWLSQRVHLRGWMDTLGWRYYTQTGGAARYTSPGSGTQGIGYSSTVNKKIAQRFTPAQDFTPTYLWLRARKQGAPADTLTAAIHSESGGLPGTSLMGGAVTAGEINGTMQWIRFTLSEPALLSAGTNYWVVAARSGGVDADNYFTIGVDESLGDSAGICRVYGSAWGARGTNADMNYAVLEYAETTAQLEEIAAAGQGGQFLSGVRVEEASGVTALKVRDQIKDCLSEALEMARLGYADGRAMLAAVTPERLLRFYPRPAAETPALILDVEGGLRDRFYRPLPLRACPVGAWALSLLSGCPVYIARVEYTDGKLQLFSETSI